MIPVQRGLRICVCAFYAATVVLHVVSMILSSVEVGIPGGSWRNWVGLVLEVALFATYFNSRRVVEERDRALTIVALCGVLMYMVGSQMKDDIESNAGRYFCDSAYSRTNACVIDRIRYISTIAAVFFSLVEVVYTLLKGPIRMSPPETCPESVITISPVHHPYGIQPNIVAPSGEGRSQGLQSQPLCQQQPIYPPHVMHSYPLTQLNTATLSAVPSTSNEISTAALFPQQLFHTQQRLSTFKHGDPNEDDATSQSPHPYSPRAYSQPLPIVTDIPPIGVLPSTRVRRHSIVASSTEPPVLESRPHSLELTSTSSFSEQNHSFITGPTTAATAASIIITPAEAESMAPSSHDLGPPPPYYQIDRTPL